MSLYFNRHTFEFKAFCVEPKKRKSPPVGRFTATDSGRFSWEAGDCSVRAMAAATGKPYAECHAALKAAGRKDKHGCTAGVITKALGGLPIQTTGVYRNGTRQTAASFIREHQRGVFIVFVTGHFFALVNGVHLDMDASLYRPRSRLWGYWQIA